MGAKKRPQDGPFHKGSAWRGTCVAEQLAKKRPRCRKVAAWMSPIRKLAARKCPGNLGNHYPTLPLAAVGEAWPAPRKGRVHARICNCARSVFSESGRLVRTFCVTRVFLFELIPDTRRNKCNLQNWWGPSKFFGKPDGRWSLHEGTARLAA